MGLGDIYNNVPDSFAGQANRQLGQAFTDLPNQYRSYLQDQGIKQQNVDQAYNSPARPANPNEQAIGNYYKQIIGHGDPNVPQEWPARLHQELTQGQPQGLNQPQGPQGIQGIQNLGNDQTQSPNFSPAMFAPASQGGYGLSPPEQSVNVPVPQEYQGPPTQSSQGLQAPSSRDFATSMPQPLASNTPMTRGDLDQYARMAPFLAATRERKGSSGLTYDQRLGLEDKKLNTGKELDTAKTGNKITLNEQKQGSQGDLQTQAEKAKAKIEAAKIKLAYDIANQRHLDTLASIEARIKIGTGTAMEVARLRSDASTLNAQIAAAARIRSSIPEIADDKEAKASANELEERARQALINVNKMGTVPSNSNTQTQSQSMKVTAPQGMMTESQKAMTWLKANPNSPWADAVRKKLGLAK